jgi:hypothetical protein
MIVLCYYYSWKDWCAAKFMDYWGTFLQRPDAQRDPQYATIRHIYDTAMQAGEQAKAKKAAKQSR